MSLKTAFIGLLLLINLKSICQDTLLFKYDNGGMKGLVVLEDEMFNGFFKSFYPNGKLKATGNFADNQRTGNWIVFDTAGVKRILRRYTDNRSFITLEKNNSLNNPINQLKQESLHDNDSTYILKEEDVLFARTLFIEVDSCDKDFIRALLNCGQEKGYKEERLWGELGDEINWTLHTKNVNGLGVMVQVKWIYDSAREMAFTRIFAIGLFEKTSELNEPFCWMWYPDVRQLIKKENSQLLASLDLIHELRIDLNCKEIKSIVTKNESINPSRLEQNELIFDLFDLEHIFWFNINGHYEYGNKRFRTLYIGH